MTIGTLADLAGLDGMPCVPTIRRLIAARPDFPVIEHGRSGRAYRIDLDAASTFIRAHWSDQRFRTPEISGAGVADIPIGGTLRELAALAGMPSEPSLRRFIASRPDFPVIERGGYDRAYRFDLAAAAAFVAEHWRDGRQARRADDTLDQFTLFGSAMPGAVR